MKKLLIQFLLIIFLSTTIYAETIELVRHDYYPKLDDDYFFRPIVDLIILNGSLFGVENFSHKVLMFSIKDDIELIKQIGGAGQAPGEFWLPSKISIWNADLLIRDNSNFSFFDRHGKFKKRFIRPAYGGGSIFLYSHDKVFMLNPKIDESHFIDGYTKDGEKISEFGEKYLDIDLSKYQGFRPSGIGRIVYEGILLSEDENIIYLNYKFGDIIKLNQSGDIVSKSNFSDYFGQHGKQVLRANKKIFIEEGVKLNRIDNFIPDNAVIDDAYLSSGKIYLIESEYTPGEKESKDRIRIIGLDKDSFEVIEEYVFNIDEENRIFCLAVAQSQCRPIFYISMETDDYIIAEYRIKE